MDKKMKLSIVTTIVKFNFIEILPEVMLVLENENK